jgi:membrane-bound serine protease (ClpP class)
VHGVLAFIAGICTTLGVILIALALTGITYYGISSNTELAAALIALVIAAIAIVMLYFALRAQSNKIETGKEALIGATGKTTTDLNPNGTVRVNGEFWQATTKTGAIKEGTAVKVIDMQGMFVIVQPTEEKA